MTPVFEWRGAPPGDFAVIGDPVSHSLSPRMHAAGLAQMGLDLCYRAIRVHAGEVAPAIERLRSLGYRGVNVTVPHKAEARAAMRTVDEFAARCDAVNTIRLEDLHGINTDGSGFLDTLEGLVPPGCAVLLLGAGGSARALALALTLAGYNLSIFNRTRERAAALVRELAIEAEVVDDPGLQDVQLIVNATSASLRNESPISFGTGESKLQTPNSRGQGQKFKVKSSESKVQSPNSKLAYDLVYGDTPFLLAAREAGLRTIDGKRLLVAQGARSLEFWLGRDAPRDAMFEAIR